MLARLADMTTPAIAIPEDEPDRIGLLVMGWIASKRSVHTRRAYARDISRWLDWCAEFGSDPLDPGETTAATWARHLEADGRTNTTVARKLSAVSSFYDWLIRARQIDRNPLDHLPRPEVDRDMTMTPGLTREQALGMITAADTIATPQVARTSALIAVMILTGARVSEVTGAAIEDIGMDRGHRVLWVTRKGGKRQPLLLPPPAAERLDTYLASRDDMSDSPALMGQPGASKRRVLFATSKGRQMAGADVWRLVRRVGKVAGLPADLVSRICPHAMRHTYATLALDAGVPLRDVQDGMGHSSADQTRRYDRSRGRLDRAPGYALAGYLAQAES